MAKWLERRVRWREVIQLGFAAMSNSFVTGFAAGKIYQGDLKQLCAPGLNCYSCPGALLSCPIGSLQAVLSGRGFQISLYVFGMLLVFGSVLGRMVCGFLCPFGMIQEWLHRIPTPRKFNSFRGDRPLRRLKYLLLAVLVILLPMLFKGEGGVGSPTFCKYVCPAGTLEGGVPLVLLNPGAGQPPLLLQGPVQGLPALGTVMAGPVFKTGWLFTWKMALLVATLLLSVLVYRPFCRYLCPLGAIYGLLNPVALYRLRLDSALCIACGKCRRACKMGLDPQAKQNEAECVRCGDCVNVCPTGALQMGFRQKQAGGLPIPLSTREPKLKGRSL
ncbi:MAG: 4Fe-4S binding protein [Christensenellales bacterium]